MKAILHLKYGSPDVLFLKEIEKPTPRNNELLVKVCATTVNRTDCAMLSAKPFIMRFIAGIFKPKNPIMGTDFAGEIEAVGTQVTKFKVGDKIFGFDDLGLGSHAQYTTISENNAISTIPDNTTYAQAAASIEGAHYAYNFINKVEIKSGQKVLVNGATGAIGSAAVQLLKYFGAIVTAVCDGKYTELVNSIGADKVIDYTKMDFTKTNKPPMIFAITKTNEHFGDNESNYLNNYQGAPSGQIKTIEKYSDEKYHYVFDAVGKSSFLKCKPLLGAGGVYISSELGFMSQNLFLPLFTAIFGNKKVKFPFPNNRKRSVLLIKKLLQEGKFKAVIDRVYPMEKIAEAFRYVESGQKIGNVIITFE